MQLAGSVRVGPRPAYGAGAVPVARRDGAGVTGFVPDSSHAPRPFRPLDHCRFATGAGAPRGRSRIGMSLVLLGDSASDELLGTAEIRQLLFGEALAREP